MTFGDKDLGRSLCHVLAIEKDQNKRGFYEDM